MLELPTWPAPSASAHSAAASLSRDWLIRQHIPAFDFCARPIKCLPTAWLNQRPRMSSPLRKAAGWSPRLCNVCCWCGLQQGSYMDDSRTRAHQKKMCVPVYPQKRSNYNCKYSTLMHHAARVPIQRGHSNNARFICSAVWSEEELGGRRQEGRKGRGCLLRA